MAVKWSDGGFLLLASYLFEMLIAKTIEMIAITQTIDNLIATLLDSVNNFILSIFCGISILFMLKMVSYANKLFVLIIVAISSIR